MDKIKLTVEDLQVSSFATSETEAAAGTVNGHGQQGLAITQLPGCVPGCNTRLTCSTNLC
ncbi:pinensin family lanthipeptide [Longimicrobium sp.]|uniref:pinensin family lanthipeptide n=1 Tax=Longimicrobium sp. TaxID=2029185 RepID=UPI003B3A82D0